MLIDAMPAVLRWDESTDTLARVFRAYVDLLADALGRMHHRLSLSDSNCAAQLAACLASVSDDSYLRVLTAPETSYRLLWNGGGSDSARAHFLLGALRAEAACRQPTVHLANELWTALGDIGFKPEGTRLGDWHVDGLMPIDFGSPHVGSVVLGESASADGEWEPFSEAEIDLVRNRFELARMGIEATEPSLLDFVRWFNRVVVCIKDASAPSSSTSGSTGQYVGRSFVTNPHLPGVDEVFVAEALVHEGIHGLLYMQERKRQWVTDSLYTGSARITSPWSGSSLLLRPYLQACFVWYGLLHFWCMAFRNNAFAADGIRPRISRALSGFIQEPLTVPLRQFEEGIDPDILAAIDRMQDSVANAFAEISPTDRRTVQVQGPT